MWDPLKKEFIKCANPDRFIVEACLQGQSKDNILNVLTPLNWDEINPGKRKPAMGEKKIEKILDEIGLDKWLTDNQGYASFDGTDDYVSLSQKVYLGNQTYSAWVYNLNNKSALFGKKESTTNQFITYTGTKISFEGDTNNDACFSNVNLDNNQWHNIIVIITPTGSSNCSIYVNNNLLNRTDDSLTNSNISLNSIGYSGDGSAIYHNGSLDNVQIFNKSLSQAEITSLYNYGRQTKGICNLITDGQVACYDFDDNSFGDGSGNGNYGTPSGFSSTTPEVNDVRSLSGSDYSLTSGGVFTVLNGNYKYRLLNVNYDYTSATAVNSANIIIINQFQDFLPWLGIILLALAAGTIIFFIIKEFPHGV